MPIAKARVSIIELGLRLGMGMEWLEAPKMESVMKALGAGTLSLATVKVLCIVLWRKPILAQKVSHYEIFFCCVITQLFLDEDVMYW